VDLLAVPRKNEHRIFAGIDRKFWQTSGLIPPVYAIAPEGDCLPEILYSDGMERLSTADENDLSTKEEIELEFEVNRDQLYGLVVASRQTLLPTYLLYQTLAYMGNDAGHWLAEIERRNIGGEYSTVEKLIGGIEVYVMGSEAQWDKKGIVGEHGPLATDTHMIPIGSSENNAVKIKLRMTKGAWRIDYVSLTALSEPVQPMRLHPYVVMKDDVEDEGGRAILLDSSRVLVTMPGDTYTLKYRLPDDTIEYEYFLESRGYYLEWIRKEWIEEENPWLLAEMFLAPERALRRLAPEFKRVESDMEESFWRSRYAKP
jgi:hypothetical protein